MLHGQTRYNVASRFLDELPEEVVKRLTLRPGTPGSMTWPGLPSGERRQSQNAGSRVPHRPVGAAPEIRPGVIVNAEGSGSDARLQINFGKQGMKWLALEYAKLTAA